MQIKFDLYELVKNDKAVFLIICLMGIISILPIINSIYYFSMVQSDAFAATGTTLMALFTFLFATKQAKEAYYKRLADRPILEFSNQKVKGNKMIFEVKNVGNSAAMELKLITTVHFPDLKIKYNKQNKIIEVSEKGFISNQKRSKEIIANIIIINDTTSNLSYGYEPLTMLRPNEKTEMEDYAYIHVQERNNSYTRDLSELPVILRKIKKRFAYINMELRYVYLDEIKYELVTHLIFDEKRHKNLEDAWKARFEF
jgi:hypothetical protein|uniref:Uncharacterized protein n=1 Tax=Candidatus Parvarchaeum acidiphilum ARMAN-4 TaxID=662760 RepID=A0A1L3KS35_PARA4|nr:hypothetical protein [Candidatus Parvarchaeum acidiphilum ARMAN-4]